MRLTIFLLFFTLISQSVFSQDTCNDSYFIKTEEINDVISYQKENAVCVDGDLKRASGGSIDEWYILPNGKKAQWNNFWDIFWVTSSVEIKDLDAKETKKVLYIIDDLFSNEVADPDLHLIPNFNNLNQISTWHFQNYQYEYEYVFRNLVEDYNIDELISINGCDSNTEDYASEIENWAYEDHKKFDIIVFIYSGLVTGDHAGQAIFCSKPQIIIGGKSSITSEAVITHEMYHCSFESRDHAEGYNYSCSPEPSDDPSYEHNVLHPSIKSCNYFLDYNQVLSSINSDYDFESTYAPSNRFPEFQYCMCEPLELGPTFNGLPDQTPSSTERKSNTDTLNGKEINNFLINHFARKKNKKNPPESIIDLLEKFDVGNSFKIDKSIDKELKLVAQNYPLFRQNYRKIVEQQTKTTSPKALNKLFNLKTNKESYNRFIQNRVNGHMDLIDDNYLALLKNRLLKKEPRFNRSKLIRSLDTKFLSNYYLNFDKPNTDPKPDGR